MPLLANQKTEKPDFASFVFYASKADFASFMFFLLLEKLSTMPEEM